MQETNDRNTDGTFAKGKSGNPSGRAKMPPEVREMLTAKAKDAVGVIVKYLGDGDPRVALKAAELLLDRAYGKVQTASDGISLEMPPEATTPAGLLALHGALLNAVAVGQAPLAEAREFSALLESQRRLTETADLETRITRLEHERKK